MSSYFTDAHLQIKISALYRISGPCYICQYGDSWTMLKTFQEAKYFIKLYPFSGLKGSFTTRKITVTVCNNIHETVHCSGLWVVVFCGSWCVPLLCLPPCWMTVRNMIKSEWILISCRCFCRAREGRAAQVLTLRFWLIVCAHTPSYTLLTLAAMFIITILNIYRVLCIVLLLTVRRITANSH